MSALVIGAGGMLGRAWMALLASEGNAHEGLDFPDFDLTKTEDLTRITSVHSLVVCCAAYTDVDGAESDEERATAVNGHAIGALAHRCAELNVPLIHYSTDYVFDGSGSVPYTTDAPLDPINAYGRSKAMGEKLIAEAGGAHLIIRTSWLYAPWAKNFVLTMAKLTADKDALTVVDDQRGRPTSAEHLARISQKLHAGGHRGIFHVTDGGECTWHGLASFVSQHLGHTCDVAPCTSDAFPRPAPRPAYSVLDLSSTEAAVGEMTDWKKNVAAVLDAPRE